MWGGEGIGRLLGIYWSTRFLLVTLILVRASSKRIGFHVRGYLSELSAREGVELIENESEYKRNIHARIFTT